MENWVGDLIEQMGYAGIALLMFLENLFPPIPSEVVMPLAGFEAAQPGGLNIFGVTAAGIAGSMLGALMWYYVGAWLNEERLKRWVGKHGRWVTIRRKDVDRADRWFHRWGTWAVLFGRLVPTVRTLIAIPAGLFEMPLRRYLVATLIGTTVWTGALAYGGYALGESHAELQKYIDPVSTGVLVLIGLVYLYRVITFGAAETA